MTYAVLSCDLDTVDRHLQGYGFDAPPCDLIYRTAVPRILELFDELEIPGVFFVIARDAYPGFTALLDRARSRAREPSLGTSGPPRGGNRC